MRDVYDAGVFLDAKSETHPKALLIAHSTNQGSNLMVF